jgi:hypothetical protein
MIWYCNTVHRRCVTFITLYRQLQAYVDFHVSASLFLRGTVKLHHSLFIRKAQAKLQTPLCTPGYYYLHLYYE